MEPQGKVCLSLFSVSTPWRLHFCFTPCPILSHQSQAQLQRLINLPLIELMGSWLLLPFPDRALPKGVAPVIPDHYSS